MEPFTPHTTETAAAEAQEMLAEVEKNYGFIPNLIGNIDTAEDALQEAFARALEVCGFGAVTATPDCAHAKISSLLK